MERWQQVEEIFHEALPPAASGQSRYWQISNAFKLAWSRNGHELYYTSGDQIMAASYTVEGDVFGPENPRVWIAKLELLGAQWDVDSSGNRVAVITPVGAPEAPKADHTFVLLENFFDELRRRVPLGK